MFALSDIIPEDPYRVWVNPHYVNYSVWLCTVGGLCGILGFSVVKTNNIVKSERFKFKYNRLLYFTIILFVSFLLTAGEDFFRGGVYKGSGGDAFGEGVSAYIQLLFSICIILLTFFVVLEKENHLKSNLLKWIWSLNKKYLALATIYIVLFLSIGDRGGPISLILTFLILVGSFIRPFKLKEVILIVLVGATIMTLVGLGRSFQTNQSILVRGYENLKDDSKYNTTLELAGSVSTLYRSVAEIPENRDFFYGKLWLNDLMSPIPFMQTVYVQLTNEDIHYLSSSSYLTYLIYGKNAPSGAGTSLIADFYLNFGVIGVLILMFLTGMLIKKANNAFLVQNNYHWIVIAIILASMSLYLGRSSIMSILRPIIWSLLIMHFFVQKRRIEK